MRRERDNTQVAALLDRLAAVAADENQNIMPVTIELVAAGGIHPRLAELLDA